MYYTTLIRRKLQWLFLISAQVDFRAKNTANNKEVHFITIKLSIYKQDTTFKNK